MVTRHDVLDGCEEDDGSFYAEGERVMRRPTVTRINPLEGTYISMGWCIAETSNPTHAQPIAEALNVKFFDEIEAARTLIERHRLKVLGLQKLVSGAA